MNLKRVFQIVHNDLDPRFPLATADESQTIVDLGTDLEVLADYAFDYLGADVVEHYGQVLRADSRYRRET